MAIFFSRCRKLGESGVNCDNVPLYWAKGSNKVESLFGRGNLRNPDNFEFLPAGACLPSIIIKTGLCHLVVTFASK